MFGRRAYTNTLWKLTYHIPKKISGTPSRYTPCPRDASPGRRIDPGANVGFRNTDALAWIAKCVPNKRNDSDSSPSLPRLPCGAHHTRVPDRKRRVSRRTRRRIKTLQSGAAVSPKSTSNRTPGTTPPSTADPLYSPCASTTTCLTSTYDTRFECTFPPHTRPSRRAGNG